MHFLIGVITYGKHKEEAFDKAKSILDGLCGEDKPFDYYSTSDDDFSRWQGQKIMRVKSKKGKELVNKIMQYTKENFLESLKIVKRAIRKHTNEELFEGSDYLFKYRCSCLGQYKGSDIRLYDNDGQGIRDNKHLKDTLTKWKSLGKKVTKEYAGMNVYITTADVHN